MNSPRVSVVIPTYNYASFVVDAVESALGQSYRDREIIVVDDGSVDDTADRLRPYLDRITYLYQENRGLSAARNAGIRAARGGLISLLDSDDVWHPHKLRIQVAHLDANPGVVAVAAMQREFSGPVLEPAALPEIRASRVAFADLVKRSRFGPSGIVVRREGFDRAGMFDENLRSAEDRDMWIRLARHDAIDLILAPLWDYRMHGSSMSRNASRMEQNEATVLRKAFDAGVPPALRRAALSYAAYSSSYMYKESGLYGRAIRRMARSAWFGPWPYSRDEVRTPWARPKLLASIVWCLVKQATGGDHAHQPTP